MLSALPAQGNPACLAPENPARHHFRSIPPGAAYGEIAIV